ncbi:hypothetical protein VN12_16725 [Pirellula sp. SH-Sr6A]|uniref:helix-turn-helix domain-containing protein n=1 Tax=Pirellula sp. SH-Sr6A TaxID=1632865 RepID=UPI00078D3B66|nr:helix-turn-helix domain-containing protein [Pirellula sp. SH-Sr6A]AMV33775.1 hypothetical protein VN12_16725 [Pirellula sp. SH-Sr6A]
MSTALSPSSSTQCFIRGVRVMMGHKGISETQLAKSWGRTIQQVNQFLLGKNGNPSLRTCDQLAEALNATTIEILQAGAKEIED